MPLTISFCSKSRPTRVVQTELNTACTAQNQEKLIESVPAIMRSVKISTVRTNATVLLRTPHHQQAKLQTAVGCTTKQRASVSQSRDAANEVYISACCAGLIDLRCTCCLRSRNSTLLLYTTGTRGPSKPISASVLIILPHLPPKPCPCQKSSPSDSPTNVQAGINAAKGTPCNPQTMQTTCRDGRDPRTTKNK